MKNFVFISSQWLNEYFLLVQKLIDFEDKKTRISAKINESISTSKKIRKTIKSYKFKISVAQRLEMNQEFIQGLIQSKDDYRNRAKEILSERKKMYLELKEFSRSINSIEGDIFSMFPLETRYIIDDVNTFTYDISKTKLEKKSVIWLVYIYVCYELFDFQKFMRYILHSLIQGEITKAEIVACGIFMVVSLPLYFYVVNQHLRVVLDSSILCFPSMDLDDSCLFFNMTTLALYSILTLLCLLNPVLSKTGKGVFSAIRLRKINRFHILDSIPARLLMKLLGSTVIIAYLAALIDGVKVYPNWSEEQFLFLVGIPYSFVFLSFFAFIHFLVLALLYFANIRRFMYYKNLDNPENRFLLEMSSILISTTSLSKNKDLFFNYNRREMLLERISEASYLVGVDYPNKIGLTDSEARRKFIGIGSYIYRLRLWVITPKHDTLDHLSDEILKILEMIFRNDWDALSELASQPNVRLEDLKRRQRIHELKLTCKKILVASIPLLIALAVHGLMSKFFEGSFDFGIDFLIAGAVLYFILQCLSIFSPDFDKDVAKAQEVAKEFKDLISFFK